jgi:hypothetical protein
MPADKRGSKKKRLFLSSLRIHRLLLEYFAARYVEPSVGRKNRAKPSSIEHEL